MQAELEAGDNAEIPAATSQGPEEVRVLGGAGAHGAEDGFRIGPGVDGNHRRRARGAADAAEGSRDRDVEQTLTARFDEYLEALKQRDLKALGEQSAASAHVWAEACKLVDQMEISQQNQDVQGDLYEYLLSQLNSAGRNGQFRTPRHIIRLMVQMIDPKPNERIGDLAGGTCGFPVNAYQYILETHTSPDVLTYDEEGWPHNLIGDRLTEADREWLQTQAFRAYDNDSGMTMLRIGSMNLMLHGIAQPRFFYMDTLSKAFNESKDYDVILMNPPFKGAVDKNDIHPTLAAGTTKSELLFLHLILRALDMGGRCAVIVPDGVQILQQAIPAYRQRATAFSRNARCPAQ